MAGRGPTSFQKRQKEQQRKEKQQEKLLRRQQRKEEKGEGNGLDSAIATPEHYDPQLDRENRDLPDVSVLR